MPPPAAVVGRERELAVIESFLAAEPCPRALVVEGEPGAGKTTLLRAAIARAPEVRVLACWPALGESALSFVALGDLLRPHVDEVLPGLPRPQRRALAGALYLDEATDDVAGVHVVGAATLNALGLLAARRPALVVVDDGQWLDAASAEALAWVVRRLPDRLPLRLLLARRVSRDPLPLDLERALDGALLTRLAPEPLGDDAIYALVRERLGVVLGGPALRRVCELSGGNPFFALELARAGADGGLPSSLAGLVEGRLSRLPDETVHALAVCAHLARPTLDVLSTATDGDAWTLLDPALDGGVVEVADGVVRFAHPLLAEAARAALAPSAERALHVRLAEIAPTAEERVAHRAEIVSPPDETTALALEAAAEQARRRGAVAAARQLALDAVRFSGASPDALGRRVLRAADALNRAGDAAAVEQLVREQRGRLPAGPLRAQLLAWNAARNLPVAASSDMEQALREARGDPTALTSVWTARATVATMAGDWAASARAGRRALEYADQAEPSVAAFAYAQTGVTVLLRAEPDAERLLTRASELEATSGCLIEADSSPELALGMARMFADRLDEARELMERRLATATDAGDETVRGGASLHLAEVEWRAGDWTRAAAYAALADRLAEQSGDVSESAGWVGGLIAACQGSDEARDRLGHGLRACESTGVELFAVLYRWGLGLLELSIGRPDDALIHLDGLSGAWERIGVVDHGVSHHASDELEALIVVGREADAERRIAEEAARAEDLDRDRLRGVVDRARGMLASRRGAHDAAVEVLLRAEALHGAGPLPFDHGRTLLALGEAQRRAGRRRDARASLQSAATIFERLGARPWSARTEAELGRLGGRVASGDELTATEQRVATLVAGGRTNREVAAELVVSVRAVEANLTRVYAKLGVRSRAELAARFRA
jgi:DNA-binding CsgD family transcriptional regulator